MQPARGADRDFDGFVEGLFADLHLDDTDGFIGRGAGSERERKAVRSAGGKGERLFGQIGLQGAAAIDAHRGFEGGIALVHEEQRGVAAIAQREEARQGRLHDPVAFDLNARFGGAGLARVIGHGHEAQRAGELGNIKIHDGAAVRIERDFALPERDGAEARGADRVEPTAQGVAGVAARRSDTDEGFVHERHQFVVEIEGGDPEAPLGVEGAIGVGRLEGGEQTDALVHGHERDLAARGLPGFIEHAQGGAQAGERRLRRRRFEGDGQLRVGSLHRQGHDTDGAVGIPFGARVGGANDRDGAVDVGRILGAHRNLDGGGVLRQGDDAGLADVVRFDGEEGGATERGLDEKLRSIAGSVAGAVPGEFHASRPLATPFDPVVLVRGSPQADACGGARGRVARHQRKFAGAVWGEGPFRWFATRGDGVFLHEGVLFLGAPLVLALRVAAQHGVPLDPIEGERQRLAGGHRLAVRSDFDDLYTFGLADAHGAFAGAAETNIEGIEIEVGGTVGGDSTPACFHDAGLLHDLQGGGRAPGTEGLHREGGVPFGVERLRAELEIDGGEDLLFVAELPVGPLARGKGYGLHGGEGGGGQPVGGAAEEVFAANAKGKRGTADESFTRREKVHANLGRHKVLQRHGGLAKNGVGSRHGQLDGVAAGGQEVGQFHGGGGGAEFVEHDGEIAIDAAIRAAHPEEDREGAGRLHLVVAHQRLQEDGLARAINAALAEDGGFDLLGNKIGRAAQTASLFHAGAAQIDIGQVPFVLRGDQERRFARRQRKADEALFICNAITDRLVVLRVDRHQHIGDRRGLLQRVHPDQNPAFEGAGRDAKVRDDNEAPFAAGFVGVHLHPVDAARFGRGKGPELNETAASLIRSGGPLVRLHRSRPGERLGDRSPVRRVFDFTQRQMHQVVGEHRAERGGPFGDVHPFKRYEQLAGGGQISATVLETERRCALGKLKAASHALQQNGPVRRREPLFERDAVDGAGLKLAANAEAAAAPVRGGFHGVGNGRLDGDILLDARAFRQHREFRNEHWIFERRAAGLQAPKVERRAQREVCPLGLVRGIGLTGGWESGEHLVVQAVTTHRIGLNQHRFGRGAAENAIRDI